MKIKANSLTCALALVCAAGVVECSPESATRKNDEQIAFELKREAQLVSMDERIVFIEHLASLDLPASGYPLHRAVAARLKELNNTGYVNDWVNKYNPGVLEGNVVCDYQMSAVEFHKAGFQGDCDDIAIYGLSIYNYRADTHAKLLHLSRFVDRTPDVIPEGKPTECILTAPDNQKLVEQAHRTIYVQENGEHIFVDAGGVIVGATLEDVLFLSGYTSCHEIGIDIELATFGKSNLRTTVVYPITIIDPDLFEKDRINARKLCSLTK